MNKKNIKINKKVYLGLSGGVDSSVSAVLLKEAGYDVTGVYIKGWQPDWIECTWKEDRLSAMRSAAYLDIPFKTIDLEKEYKEKVVNYIVEEYAKGNTPNPDMLCNREIKFGAFLNYALEDGADFIATGHYAQNTPLLNKEGQGVVFNLTQSKDTEKDQTYFLSQLTQKELKHVLFPIGHLLKSEVRKIAQANNLPVASRKDSQGICFIGDMDMAEFLKLELNPVKGIVQNEKGENVGEHDGAILYTIGQRHGFEIFNNDEESKKYFVIKKDIEKNVLIVSDKKMEEKIENIKENILEVKEISFTNSKEEMKIADEVLVMLRYRSEKLKVKLIKIENQNYFFEIEKYERLRESAAGQFAVFYKNSICLGGGVIA